MPNWKLSRPPKLILVGASTGGPGHIQKILSSLPSDFYATIVIAQHIGDEYIPSFVKQMDDICPLPVSELKSDSLLNLSHVYICSSYTQLIYRDGQLRATRDNNRPCNYNPDINALFCSAAEIDHKLSILAIILTGIGDDGALGCQKLSQAGAQCIAENEQSAVVFGMPRQAIKMTENIDVLPLTEIINRITNFEDDDV